MHSVSILKIENNNCDIQKPLLFKFGTLMYIGLTDITGKTFKLLKFNIAYGHHFE